MPSLRELWKISGIYYRNLNFLTLIESRTSHTKGVGIEKLAKNANRSVVYNKIFISLIFLFSAIFAAMESSVMGYAAFMLLLMFLFSFFFLQTVTYFFQLNFHLLYTLPISPEDIRKVMFLTFIRIFDIPLILNLFAFPLAVSIFNLWYSAFPAFFGILLSELFSVAIVTSLSKFFYTKLSQPSGGWKEILRVIFQIIWAATFFIFYAVMMWIRTLYTRLSLYEPIIEKYALIFKLIFPFNFSYLILSPDFISFGSSILFLFLGYLSIRWTINNISRIKELKVEEVPPPEKIRMKITGQIYGIIRKDIKMISRNPGLLMLVFLPTFEGILLMALGNSLTASLYMVFTFVIILTYTLFGFEKLMIMKLLPIPKGKVYLSKIFIGILVFGISLVIMDIYLFFKGEFPDIVEQLILLPAAFSAGVVCLYLGDRIGIKRSAGLSALGFILIVALGNVMLYLPGIGGLLFKGSTEQNLVASLISLIEFLIGVAIIKTAR